jgi:hypothetical protein
MRELKMFRRMRFKKEKTDIDYIMEYVLDKLKYTSKKFENYDLGNQTFDKWSSHDKMVYENGKYAAFHEVYTELLEMLSEEAP